MRPFRLTIAAAALIAAFPAAAHAGDKVSKARAAEVQAIAAARADQIRTDQVGLLARQWANAWGDYAALDGTMSHHAVSTVLDRQTSMNLRSLERAASFGDSGAQAALGLFHLSSGTHRDPVLAFQYNLDAAEAGVAVAQTALGLQLLNGVGVTRNESAAAEWLEVAALRGHNPAAFQIGTMYLDGVGVNPDNVQARYWLLRAREAGDVRADRLLKQF